MNKTHTKNLLYNYQTFNKQEADSYLKIINFINSEHNHFDRNNEYGHFTASSWITSPDLKKVILLFHSKFNKWIQPGGHADNETNLIFVAEKEAHEETCLESLQIIENKIYDLGSSLLKHDHLDNHYHFDLRFHFIADPGETPKLEQGKAEDIQWLDLDQAYKISSSDGVKRMVEKTKLLGGL